MKVLETNKSLACNTLDSCVQSIAPEHIAKATYFLRDKIYTDKRKAALCETLCNAVDEHRKHNIEKQVLVTIDETEVSIRDYALGLSNDDVMKIFFQYFESTKSEDNNGIGGFGIGAKSPGAYAPIYYVESYHDGMRSLFASSVNGFQSDVNLISSKPCDISDTGICVHIPYQKTFDRTYFNYLAQDLAAQIGFFVHKHEIKILERTDCSTSKDEQYLEVEYTKFNELCTESKSSGHYYRYEKDFVFMSDNTCRIFISHHLQSSYYRGLFNNGFVVYDGDNLYKFELNEDIKKLCDSLNLHSGQGLIFFFKRGELFITPSREQIELTTNNISWLKDKITKFDEFLSKEIYKSVDEKFNDNHPLGKCLEISACITNFRQYVTTEELKLANIITESTDKATYNSYVKLQSKYSIKRKTFDFTNFYTNVNKSFYDFKQLKNVWCPAFIGIVFDVKQNISQKGLIKCLYAYLKANNLFVCENEYYLLNVFDVKNEEDRKEIVNDFETFAKTIRYNDKLAFRKNVDYFLVSDLLKFYTPPAKSEVEDDDTPKIVISPNKYDSKVLKDFKNNIIPESEFGKTLLVTPGQLKEDLALKNILEYSYLPFVGALTKVTGHLHLAKCFKRDIDKYVAKGAIPFYAEDLKPKYCNWIETNKITVCSTLVRNFQNLVSLNDSELSKLIGFTYDSYISSGSSHRLLYSDSIFNNYFVKLFGTNFLKQAINRTVYNIDRQIIEAFNKLTPEEINYFVISKAMDYYNYRSTFNTLIYSDITTSPDGYNTVALSNELNKKFIDDHESTRGIYKAKTRDIFTKILSNVDFKMLFKPTTNQQ